MGYFVTTELTACRVRPDVSTDQVLDAIAPIIGEALGLVPECVEVDSLATIARRRFPWGTISYDAASHVVSWTIKGKFVGTSYLEKLQQSARGLESLSDDAFHFTWNNDSVQPDRRGSPHFFAADAATRERAESAYQVERAIAALPADDARRAMAAGVLRLIFDRDPQKMHVLWVNTLEKSVDGIATPAAAAARCRELIRDDDSIAHVFEVVDTDATERAAVSVDLDEVDDDQVVTMGMSG